MALTISEWTGKLLYAIIFCVALPALLILWARESEASIDLPVPRLPLLGFGLAILGVWLMVAGMIALWRRGGGLPMNPYPPTRHVASGVYGIIAHPIYTGFCALSVGVSLTLQSSSGLWFVSPIVILGCVALVEGYETHELRARFGASRPKPVLHLAANEPTPPTMADRISVYEIGRASCRERV